mmetsp:Transcript_14883/g.51478  ORF Transcript_14883/g.51478 Transcript_14883/m.51478 type:complete len:213 (-) Transcript_14883:2170-2808(-)
MPSRRCATTRSTFFGSSCAFGGGGGARFLVAALAPLRSPRPRSGGSSGPPSRWALPVRLQPTVGSRMKGSSTFSSVSRWCRSVWSPTSRLRRKQPSTPVTPKASTMWGVSRKGTISGVLSRVPLSKMQSKSTWTCSPRSMSTMMFSPWRSPKPSTWPTADQIALDRANVARAPSHAAGSSPKRCANQRLKQGSYWPSTILRYSRAMATPSWA